MHYVSFLFIGTLLLMFATTSLSAQQSFTLEVGTNLPDLIKEALRMNPEILAARKAVEVAAARTVQARSLEDPELNVESWAIPLDQPTNFNQANMHMVNLRQRLPFPGKLRLRGEVASQEERMADARYRAKERQIIAAVKKGYYDLFMADRDIEILQGQLDVLGRMVKTAEARYTVGKVAQQDVIKAQVEQSELLNRVFAAEREHHHAEARLNTLLNRPPDAPIGRTMERDPPTVSLEREELYRLTIESSPELNEASSDIKRAELSHELAIRNSRYPDFMVGIGYWYQPQGAFQNTYSGMFTLTVPFFWTKAKHDKEVEEASAVIARTEAGYRAMKNRALFEVRENLVTFDAAKKSIALYRTGLIPQAELSLKSAESAYQTGRLEFTGLLEAERALRDVRLGYYRALVALEQSLADLERAVGRDVIR